MQGQPKVLVVDDDRDLTGALCVLLTGRGFQMRATDTGAGALALARQWDPDAILLDIQLPDADGVTVCRALRRKSRSAIILVSAYGEERRRILGLNSGADDYVTKPFSPRELAARVRAVLRRRAPAPRTPQKLVAGNLELHLDARRVTLDGRSLPCSRKEFDLLALLVSRQGQTVSRSDSLRTVWPDSTQDDSRSLDVHIRLLRQKIESDPSRPCRLVTVRGVGHRFER